jgi:hypothetical protein
MRCGDFQATIRSLTADLFRTCATMGPRLCVIIAGFQKILRCGTQAALMTTGTHRRPQAKVESAPAAITSLSAACRCASPRRATLQCFPPKLEPSQKWLGSPAFEVHINLTQPDCVHPLRSFTPPVIPPKPWSAATDFVTLAVTFSVFLTSFSARFE